MWRVVGIAMLAGCVGISDEHRCTPDPTNSDCPQGGRCEPVGNCSVPDPTCGGAGGFRYDDKSGDRSGTCIVSMAGPTGLGTLDLADQDDTVDTCGPAGARDLVVELDSDRPQILFAMTNPGLPTPIALSVRSGPCPGTDPISECLAQACAPTPIGIVLAAIPAGRSCLVAESADGATSGQFAIQIYPGLRSGTPLDPRMPTLPDQTTCTGVTEAPSMVCGNAADVQSAAYVVPLCPGTYHVTATVTPSSPLDPLVTVRPGVPYAPAEPEACVDEATGSTPEVLDAQLTGPGAYWVLVEQAAGSSCGAFDLTGISIAPI